jgi:hypothetical protein
MSITVRRQFVYKLQGRGTGRANSAHGIQHNAYIYKSISYNNKLNSMQPKNGLIVSCVLDSRLASVSCLTLGKVTAV